MTFEQALKPYEQAARLAAKAYLQGVISAAHSMQEAARVAGKNRTDFYRVCDRYGVDTTRISSRTRRAPKRPWRFSPMGV